MSDFTPSTLTSPLSSLFSEPFSPGGQSGSEIATSDEEPDLGAFTAVIRAWGYLQPQPRVPVQLSSLTSSSTRTTTTITGYPGFGGADSEIVEGSTIWDHFPINSYLRASNADSTATSSGRTERARPFLLEEPEDDDYATSPPASPSPSPESESAQTVEIASEADTTSIRSTTDEDGEGMLEPRATPSNEGQTVPVAGSQDEQMSPPAAPPASSPHISVISGSNSVTSFSVSNQILDDNTPISRTMPSLSTLSLNSYRPQMSTTRTPSSVFQETPSPAFLSVVPFQETPTSSSPAVLPGQHRPFTGRMISNSSHAESDIINSYYNREPGPVSPPSSTDHPATGFFWPRLEIPTQPRESPTQQPGREIPDSHHHRQTPSVIDDNSSASAVTEEPPPSLTTTSRPSLSQQEITTPPSADSPGAMSSHSMTPSHSVVFTGASTATLPPTTTRATVTAATSTIHSSMDSSIVYHNQYPSFSSNHHDRLPRADLLDDRQATSSSSRQHHHLLSTEGDSRLGQPSLGFLDGALQFIAAERARVNALIETESHRGPFSSGGEDEREETVVRLESERRYAIELSESQCNSKSSSANNDVLPTDDGVHNTKSTNDPSSSLHYDLSSTNEADSLLHSATTTPKKSQKKRKQKYIISSVSKESKQITILKRPDGPGNNSTSTSTSTSSSSNLFNQYTHNSHSQPHTIRGNGSAHTQTHVPATVGSHQTQIDGAATPRARTYLYTSLSSDKHGSCINDEEGCGGGKREEGGDGDDRALGAGAGQAEEGITGITITTGDGNDSYPEHGGNKVDFYIDRYGRRVRKVRGANHVAGLDKSVLDSMVEPSLEDEDKDPKDEGEEEEEDIEHNFVRGGDEGRIGMADISSSGRKKEKKRKAKKRKLPVTVPSKSRSVPDLRAEVGIADSSPEENVNNSGNGSSTRIPKSTLPPSSSFPGSQKKKTILKFAESSLIGSEFSASLAISGWLIGKNGLIRNKRARLIALARLLQKVFPGEKDALTRVIGKLSGFSPPETAEIPTKERKKKNVNSTTLLGGCSIGGAGVADSDLRRMEFEEDDDPDPRGDPPGKKDTLIHVFIDHSNILIGFLNLLKRRPKQFLSPSKSAIAHSGSTSTTARPLPIPKTKAGVPVADSKFLIPLPSFATANLSRSLPSTSFVKHDTTSGRRNAREVNSDGEGYMQSGNDGDDDEDEDEVPAIAGFPNGRRGTKVNGERKEKTKSGATKVHTRWHMWHAALAMILERGRPVSRRVVAASKPLYQPMETIERLGYEVKVFQRVPDLGDGPDRQEKTKDKDIHNGSPTKGNLSPSKASHKTHVQRISGDMSAAALPVSGQLPAGATRVKYREQGVDELLQLKLHLAITAPDDVPEGATIILATGDGNVGQFNEDGFLGAVRTALKRGWKVELYAWECCLSRSWQREFGPGSEWGKKGKFRIIILDQFAECLVELAE